MLSVGKQSSACTHIYVYKHTHTHTRCCSVNRIGRIIWTEWNIWLPVQKRAQSFMFISKTVHTSMHARMTYQVYTEQSYSYTKKE